MQLSVKLKGQLFILDEWEPTAISESNSNWIRKLSPDLDNFSCIGYMVSHDNVKSNKYHWHPMFLGKHLHSLCDIYYQFYPSPKPYYDTNIWSNQIPKYYSSLSPPLIIFQDYQIEEAKQHLDNFINRFNSLSAFI
jgi:hypothetical protein